MPTTLGPIVLRYIGDRLKRGEITRETAQDIRGHLLDFAWSFGNRPLTQLGKAAVERWLEALNDRGLAPSTRAGRLSSLRTFSRWCVYNDVVLRDFTLGANRIRRPRQAPRDMTVEHVISILLAARSSRERLIVWLMFGCGLRCVEVSRLDCDDFDRSIDSLHLVGKGLNERDVPVPPVVRAAIDTYLTEAGHFQGPLVRRMDVPQRLSKERISGIVGRLCRDAEVKVRPYDGRSAHGLRALAASELYEVCNDPRIVQDFLGHASMATGAIYIRRSKFEKVRDAQMAREFELAGRPEPGGQAAA